MRRRGHSPHDAQDLTQEFFARLLERHTLAVADPNRGRFRSFLLSTMNHFLAHEWEKVRAQKRGGGRQILSLDLARAEERYDLEPADNSSPDKLFDKHWANALLEEVLNQLEAEYQQAGKADLFAALKQTLTGTRESQPYAVLAARPGHERSRGQGGGAPFAQAVPANCCGWRSPTSWPIRSRPMMNCATSLPRWRVDFSGGNLCPPFG